MMRDAQLLLIKKILNKYDPAGVASEDSPDEYDPEAKEIQKFLGNAISNDALSKEIYKVFVSFFDENIAGDESKYEVIANEILKIEL